MKHKNLKKTFAFTLAIVSMLSVAAFASSGSTRVRDSNVYYYNTPSKGHGNAVTEWNNKISSVYMYVSLTKADYDSNGKTTYTFMDADSDQCAAGVSVDAWPSNGWSSTHEVYDGGSVVFHDGLWANAK